MGHVVGVILPDFLVVTNPQHTHFISNREEYDVRISLSYLTVLNFGGQRFQHLWYLGSDVILIAFAIDDPESLLTASTRVRPDMSFSLQFLLCCFADPCSRLILPVVPRCASVLQF
jgi:hypothetical protein